jgi:hypothetical protein
MFASGISQVSLSTGSSLSSPLICIQIQPSWGLEIQLRDEWKSFTSIRPVVVRAKSGCCRSPAKGDQTFLISIHSAGRGVAAFAVFGPSASGKRC